MAEAGAFPGIQSAETEAVAYIHLAASPRNHELAVGFDYKTVTIAGELTELLKRFSKRQTGYISRRAMEKVRFDGDYDHLARFGEWDTSHPSVVVMLE